MKIKTDQAGRFTMDQLTKLFDQVVETTWNLRSLNEKIYTNEFYAMTEVKKDIDWINQTEPLQIGIFTLLDIERGFKRRFESCQYLAGELVNNPCYDI